MNEINGIAPSSPLKDDKHLPGPWPWYAILLIGIGLTGFFVWFMVCWALWVRNQKNLCLAGLAANLFVLTAARYASTHLLCEWWVLSVGAMCLDIVWALGAWLFQNAYIGPAPPRYKNISPKKWITPVLIGGLLGFCIAALISIPQAIENRIAMLSIWDSLNREIVLWDFFKGTFTGVATGMFIGAWWAGNPNGFKVRDIVCYLAGTMVAWIGLLMLFKLQLYLLSGGGEALSMDNQFNAIVPAWGGDGGHFILTLDSYRDSMGMIILPLLFGAPDRFRDFGRRILIIPLVFACSFPYWMASSPQWTKYQGRIVYLTSSPDDAVRAEAFENLKVLLARYPEHARWPYLAEKYASYLYHQGRYEESLEYNRKIADRFKGENRWYWTVSQANQVLENFDAEKRNPGEWLEIPVVDHENYLTGNWMCLLSTIRYWEGEDVPESQIKSRLRAMSENQDLISLRPLFSFANLDDAASNLGYKTLILPSDLGAAQRLLDKGIPVFLEGYQRFYLMYGFDEGRSLSLAYNFFSISNRLLKDTRQEAEEVLGLEDEGQGKSRQRRERIRREAYWEMTDRLWKDPIKNIVSPYMAIVVPEKYLPIAAEAVGQPLEDIETQSKARLAALIGLQFVHAGDPVKAVEWAKISAEKTKDPLPLYVAHLAHTLWSNRRENVKSQIGLEKRFDELLEVPDFFERPDIQAFLDNAAFRFMTDIDEPGLPRDIYKAYLPYLHKSDPEQRRQIEAIYSRLVQTDPSRYRDWAQLADIYEFSNDTPNMVMAMEGKISAGPADQLSRLKAAYGYILMDQPEKAKEILDQAETRRLLFEADYQFVLGAISEWEKQPQEALTHYATAVDMRRHIPVYHLYYGRALLAMGKNKEARMALEWACRIDPDTFVTEKARSLLDNMEKTS